MVSQGHSPSIISLRKHSHSTLLTVLFVSFFFFVWVDSELLVYMHTVCWWKMEEENSWGARV